jgi:hypothetical protein
MPVSIGILTTGKSSPPSGGSQRLYRTTITVLTVARSWVQLTYAVAAIAYRPPAV